MKAPMHCKKPMELKGYSQAYSFSYYQGADAACRQAGFDGINNMPHGQNSIIRDKVSCYKFDGTQKVEEWISWKQ